MDKTLKSFFFKIFDKSEEKREASLIAKSIRETTKAEKRIFSKNSDKESLPEMFKMLELSLKYGALVKKVKQNGRYIWIVEVEE